MIRMQVIRLKGWRLWALIAAAGAGAVALLAISLAVMLVVIPLAALALGARHLLSGRKADAPMPPPQREWRSGGAGGKPVIDGEFVVIEDRRPPKS
jgi:hypothetical protein